MFRHDCLRGGSLLVLAVLGLAAAAGGAAAAEADDRGAGQVDEVVVTGSYIRGGVQTAALPVDVVTAEDLQRRGSPSVLELLKSLPESSGVLGETNQFDSRAQGSEGSGSVNLRGLGPQRTLVLINGRRMAINPLAQGGSGVVDTNMVPLAAIGRVEVLKDGAAATYGSDAIAGVVNFITKTNQRGFEVSGDYSRIAGSKGDYGLSVSYGWVGDRANLLLAAGWQHRSELSVADRAWAMRPYLENPEGGWNPFTNPGSYLPLTAAGTPAGTPQRDVGCAVLGGFASFQGTTPACFGNSTPNDNLIEHEEHGQIFGQLNVDVTDTTKLHVEALIGQTDVPEWATSPSYAALQTPTAEAEALPSQAGAYIAPATNPGLIAYYAANNLGAVPAGGVRILLNRPFGLGGNPLFDNGGSRGVRAYTAYRFSAGLDGKVFGDVGWNLGLTYGSEIGRRSQYDTLTDRYELALRGLGGPSCNVAANTPGRNGCLYYNPFSNAIAVNPVTGQVNPAYNSAVANSIDVAKWFFQKDFTKQTTQLLVLDAVLNGETPVALPGGKVAWAAGGQYRYDSFKSDFSPYLNSLISPCVNSPDFGVTNCTGAQRTGPSVFTGVGTPADVSTDVVAAFGELQLPVSERLQIQLAARYENYSGAIGSTFDPKIAVRLQAAPWLAFRASAGSTFRGPSGAQVTSNTATSLQSLLGGFKAVDILGNPNLRPETARTYSVGAIFTPGPLRATLDYWRFDFHNPIVTEPVAAIVATVFPTGATGANNCANPAMAALVARFTFNGACSAANATRLTTLTVNGSPVRTSGLDAVVDYDVGELWGGRLRLGGSGTYVQEYKIGAMSVAGVVVSPAYNAVGYLNYQTTAYPIPRYKGNLFIDYQHGRHSLRWTATYVDGVTDQRDALFATGAYRDTANVAVTVAGGRKIASNLTHAITYRVELPQDTVATLSVDNIFDKDPPFVRLNLNYDPFTGSPYGRIVRFTITKKFGG